MILNSRPPEEINHFEAARETAAVQFTVMGNNATCWLYAVLRTIGILGLKRNNDFYLGVT